MNYKDGKDDPKIKPDVGAGKHNSKSKSVKLLGIKVTIQLGLYAVRLKWDDAAKHLKHYFGNSGKTLTIDLRGMLDEVASAKLLYDSELAFAKKYCETKTADGSYPITSSKPQGGYNTKKESNNWYYAVGGYSCWGKGVVEVKTLENGDKQYTLDFEYKFFDRYNWDTGKKVNIGGVTITDKFMGDFHRQGLAKEFDMAGKVSEKIRWVVKADGSGATPHVVVPSGGRGGDRE